MPVTCNRCGPVDLETCPVETVILNRTLPTEEVHVVRQRHDCGATLVIKNPITKEIVNVVFPVES